MCHLFQQMTQAEKEVQDSFGHLMISEWKTSSQQMGHSSDIPV
uniref:Uncharacterized protein n=1 Tax=Marseillevirus LCMAC101 TaxID=2506602 RepID=A0A481YSU8_9VIRU|nr:MAG: hypothetical protein LCMAC101_06220 [Marseillevirus LCMAC101]